jgi:hypothetical protein
MFNLFHRKPKVEKAKKWVEIPCFIINRYEHRWKFEGVTVYHEDEVEYEASAAGEGESTRTYSMEQITSWLKGESFSVAASPVVISEDEEIKKAILRKFIAADALVAAAKRLSDKYSSNAILTRFECIALLNKAISDYEEGQ